MSLYNLMNGFNPAAFFFLPMFGKHPDDYPRFRDCFLGKIINSKNKDQFGIPLKKLTGKDRISIYMRIGGSNRSSYEKEIEEFRAMPEYVEDYDDDFDSTFAVFIFYPPERWKKDFDNIVNKNAHVTEFSEEYKRHIISIFPKIEAQLNKILYAGSD